MYIKLEQAASASIFFCGGHGVSSRELYVFGVSAATCTRRYEAVPRAAGSVMVQSYCSGGGGGVPVEWQALLYLSGALFGRAARF